MKQTRISQEPLFIEYAPIERQFVPFEKSIMWEYNSIFWKYCSLWQQTYHEDYEKSLPSNIPYSHKRSFMRDSAGRFFQTLVRLQRENRLPKDIIIVEQGPGSGVYAKGFLDNLKKWSNKTHPFYLRVRYVLSDTSSDILERAKITLQEHAEHIDMYVQEKYRSIPLQYLHKALLVRHGNMWDQFPAQLFKVNSHSIGQIHTRAVLDGGIIKHLKGITQQPLGDFALNLKPEVFEMLITTYPLLWKPLIRSIRLETKLTPMNAFSFQKLPYKTSLQVIAKETGSLDEVLFSGAILQNVSDMGKLIDWTHGGYIEVVDIITRNFSHLRKRRRPLKFDGAIAVFINGPLIKDFMRRKKKHVGFRKLKHLNTVVSIHDYDFQTLLENKQFITIAEVAAKDDEKKSLWVQKANKLLDMQVDFVTFSDRAHGWSNFVPIERLVEKDVFKTIGADMLLSVFATRRKTRESIEALISQLKQQGMKNLLVVTGDPGEYDTSSLTSLDILPILSKHFYTGAVAKPDITDMPKLLKKIEAGAKFFIVQSTYDHAKWEMWVKEIKKRGLDKKVHFIQSIIPIITKKTITAIQAFPDVPVSQDIVDQFISLPDEQVGEAGRVLSKQLITEYKDVGIFSGVYVFSKSFRVVADMVDIVNS